MKKLVIGVILLVVIFGASWYGVESWLSSRAREAVAADPRITAENVSPLRNPSRIGIRLEQLDYGDEQMGFAAPEIDLYAPALSPNRLTAELPQQMTLRLGSAPAQMTLSDGSAFAVVSPLHRMSISDAGIEAQGLKIDGADVLEALDLRAVIAHMGGAAPEGSGAGYAINLAASGIAVGSLTERLDISGPGQLWLTAPVGQAMLQGNVPPPVVTGLQSSGLRFSLGRTEATLIGRIEADANGYASGEAAFYTKDAQSFIDAAVSAGFLPPERALMAGALLKNLSETPVANETEPPPSAEDLSSTSVEVASEAAQAETEADMDQIVSLPPATDGQIRLPLILKDGRMRLGPVPVGPAPRLVP
ncbi:DUF2125 domain-containing protein [Paracoccus aerodenitrificans]|uniref:DUF2125 domain-containing protein n=1 Tax=Paracoccus aerodenitrificans TaxID=3017781 RepID=UPI0022F08150|nr:DUF2125 domain-containing protein [Paracoccus aerodenitrificans]WBU62672.1 DUF2125 domain-containing protein [Paracoccus aerodenitrificans]